jgi:phosphotriesterase-related protein
MNTPSSAYIQTVTGPISPGDAGITLSHEHVLLDGWDIFRTYDSILDDEEVATSELAALVSAGGQTIVDCTNVGIGRQPEALMRISRSANVNIVMGSGWYRRAVYPPEIRENDADALAEVLVRDILEGAGGSAARAGFIGEIGTERGRIAAAEERVFRAAARAQRRTGVSIWTHTTNSGELALEQIELLTSEGVPLERIVISHVGDRISYAVLKAIAATGVYLSIDNIGYTDPGHPPDEVRGTNVLRLVEDGRTDRILLSGDTCTRSVLLAYGGQGYARVLTSFVPRLRDRGLDEASIRSMLVDNPARALTVTPPIGSR